MNYTKQIVRNFLSLYWIRPETAVWRTLDVLQMKNIHFKKPILDLGCGDGTFSFTLFGGKCDASFDVFKIMKNTAGFFKGRDIFDQRTQFKPYILQKPQLKIDVGLDWKQNLLDHAEKLNLYNSLIQHDLNKPLPFDNESFTTIFSNVFYWINNLEQLLSESNRILKRGGKLIICVPDIKFKKNLIFNLFLNKGYFWAKALDRGIYSSIHKHCYSYSKWKTLLLTHGFVIEQHSNYLSEKFIQFHNIGMRPYSPYIIEMANHLQSKVRRGIKSRLIREILPIMESYIRYEDNLKNGCFHLFVLKKL